MHRFCKIVIAALVVTALIGTSKTYCADKQKKPEIYTFEGRVSYLDWVVSKMIVNGVGVKEFFVPGNAGISKLGRSITLADLNILDNVIVQYYEDPYGQNVVIRITVTVV